MTAFVTAFILVSVALVVPSSAHATDEAQLRMEADVRRLLNRASDPFQLAALPLAQALCELTGISDAQHALRNAVEKAFQGSWQHKRLRDLLLPSDPEGCEPRRNAAERLQVSTRHLQRRRARAVAVLALHIRNLVGAPRLATVDDRDRAAADPLETIAELVSDFDPATAASIFRLGGPPSTSKATMLVLRHCVNVGDEIKPVGVELEQYNFSPLITILRAQSKQINGKHAEAEQELWPLFTRAARDLTSNSEVRFELEWLAYLRARHRGDAREMDRVATNLKRIGQDHATWLSRALLAQAEARIRCGRLEDANALLDEADLRGLRNFAVRHLASGSLLQGEIALQRGNHAAAERLATGAYMILWGRHYDAYRAQAAIARARLRLDKPWTCPDDLGKLSTTAWDRIAVDIERARHLNAEGLRGRARTCSNEAFHTAVALKYDGLAARAAASIGVTFDKGSRHRRDWYLRALSYLLATRNRSVGCDLFVIEKGCTDATPFAPFDEAVTEVLYGGLQSAIPHLRNESETDRGAAQTFLKHLSAYVLGFTPFSDELAEAIDALDFGAGSFAQYMLYFMDEASDILEAAFAAIVSPRQRCELDQRLILALRRFASAVQPRGDLRRFLVG